MKYCIILIKLALVVSFITTFSENSAASDFGIVAGYKSDSATANNTAVTVESRNGFQFGALGLFELGPQIFLRMGFIYNPRVYGLSAGEVKLAYVEIPIGLMWKFSDFGGAYISGSVAMNSSASCPSGCSNLSSVASGYQFGVQFKFAPQMGGAFYYEAMGALVQNIENPKTVAAQFIYTFE